MNRSYRNCDACRELEVVSYVRLVIVNSSPSPCLGVTLTSNLSLDKHVANVCARASTGFVAQTGPTVTRRGVCGYAGPRYCNVTHGLLQRHSRWGIQVHHRQAPVSNECRRSRRRGLTNILHDQLHWLDVPQRMQYKLFVTVHRCQQHKARYDIYVRTKADEMASLVYAWHRNKN